MPQLPIADKTTLDAVNTKVGATGDVASAAGSIFARLAEMLTNRITAARAAKLDNLDAAVSTAKNTVTVQRGSTTITTADFAGSQNVTITAVTMSKSFVTAFCANAGTGEHCSARLTSATNLALRVNSDGAAVSMIVDWEVVQIA